jgi:rubrerythrin
MAAELDAINLYEQMAENTEDEDIRKVLLDVAKEEERHVGEFATLLKKYDPEQDQEEQGGAEEVEKLTGRSDDAWNESEHPRDADGKFGEGSGSSGSKSKNEGSSSASNVNAGSAVHAKITVSPAFVEFIKKTKSKTFPTGRPPGTLIEIKAGLPEATYESLLSDADKMYESVKGTKKEKAAGYARRSIQIGSEDKKYNVSVQLDANGDIVGATSMHLLPDSIRIETLGGLGLGAGKSCLISAIRQSIKAGKGGAITLTPLPSLETIDWYKRQGFVSKKNSRYNEFWLSPEAAKEVLK